MILCVLQAEATAKVSGELSLQILEPKKHICINRVDDEVIALSPRIAGKRSPSDNRPYRDEFGRWPRFGSYTP